MWLLSLSALPNFPWCFQQCPPSLPYTKGKGNWECYRDASMDLGVSGLTRCPNAPECPGGCDADPSALGSFSDSDS